jgi:Flp pilus assembly protein TadG
MKILNNIKTFFKCELGSVITEYAIVLPVFLVMIVGGFEIGRIYMISAALEGTLVQSTRIAMSGYLPTDYATREEYIEALVVTSLQSVGVTSGVTVSMMVYSSFANVGEAEPYVDQNGNNEYDVGECYTDVNGSLFWDADMGDTGAGGEENIMVMTVDVDLPFMTSFMSHITDTFGGIGLSGSTIIRNEPFGGVPWEASSNVLCT